MNYSYELVSRQQSNPLSHRSGFTIPFLKKLESKSKLLTAPL